MNLLIKSRDILQDFFDINESSLQVLSYLGTLSFLIFFGCHSLRKITLSIREKRLPPFVADSF